MEISDAMLQILADDFRNVLLHDTELLHVSDIDKKLQLVAIMKRRGTLGVHSILAINSL